MTQREVPSDHQEWRKQGNCKSTNLSDIIKTDKLFFLGKGGKSGKAKELCEGCPVKRNCLAFALFYGEEEGIWGGMTPDERRDMPDFLRDLMMLEATDLIDITETRDPLQWLPIIFPDLRNTTTSLDDAI
jgi:hypothetical protein